ncbi:AIPR family protein, partial [Leuconostoc mesenteroides]|uniref:AIPR family protein n=1 Tax=Leuconostoc mesenteroides TaxID=1245 RepID=UPI002362842D
VRLEVLVGESLDATGLADARNTSAQVSDIALFELDDKFDIVKNAINNQSYADDVAFKDNEDKRIPVAELLRLMVAYNINRFPDDANAPVSAYSSKASIFKDYSKNFGPEDNIYLSIADQLPTLVSLYEKIESELP